MERKMQKENGWKNIAVCYGGCGVVNGHGDMPACTTLVVAALSVRYFAALCM